ncbi:class I SAM-dependent methyltransferase [Halosquirtibacter xylanolyticus]|uniref:class I SAM-dependent methyltransferase n=1 Tax=Halosquirtibacter xylanolyticus TaxID=3374599 RepID=UPI00374A4B4B|nr:class I SAM-dependent methyltransferase [Prolixibacteraceae bacterium]
MKLNNMSRAVNEWDKRYSEDEYIYGISPNNFLKDSLERYSVKGNILMVAEGEGRNGVYVAKKGLNVYAFDISAQAKVKALRLTEKMDVTIDYKVGDFRELEWNHDGFDAIVLIYSHFPPEIRTSYFQKMISLLKNNGYVIFECFSEEHLSYRDKNPSVGGPNNIELLYSEGFLRGEFNELDILELKEKEIVLEEGTFHQGIAKVLRMVARKSE